ncbi:hypothetical protein METBISCDRAFT_26171 [Metschnikowia bicuspidata]|uniref:Rpr2-domain-containing protein n=1 Tax=Metschnikowia bicuspidata TaxID=27322 RepID=A0A4P9ZHC7_9ASCO|nr:hypothetical protein METBISCDRAFT_26171 [Metschnikowia bicuspidata]
MDGELKDAEVVHLYNLAHFKPFSPILSQHAVRADTYALHHGLAYPSHFSHCPNCGTRSFCGLTSSYKIAYMKTKDANAKGPKKKQLRKRVLHVKCLCCGCIQKTDLLNKKDKKDTSPAPGLDTKRRKKKGDLLALLDKKKELERKVKPTLDLMGFMQ